MRGLFEVLTVSGLVVYGSMVPSKLVKVAFVGADETQLPPRTIHALSREHHCVCMCVASLYHVKCKMDATKGHGAERCCSIRT
eukprot:361855-Chlamydomonas_euryale.AAC.6